MTSTNNTMVIQSEVPGFVLAPSRGRASASKGGRAVHRRPPCPGSTAVACPASRNSSSAHFWLARTQPRAGLESFLDDHLDPEEMKAADAHDRPAATKRSTYNHRKLLHQAAAMQQPLRLVAPIFHLSHRIATARRWQLQSCPCSPPSCCVRCAPPATCLTASTKLGGCPPCRERHHARNTSSVEGRAEVDDTNS